MTTATATAARPKPVFDDEANADRKFVIICSKGSLDMAYPGLILANAALGEGIETHLFFTFWGFEMINKKTMGHMQFSPVGNPATHMPTAVSGLPGMQAMAIRLIHACGMTDLPGDLAWGGDPVGAGRAALQFGAPILVDVEMVRHGIIGAKLPARNRIICTLNDDGIREIHS